MSLILRQSNLPNTGTDFIKGSPLTYDQLDGNFAAISASLALRPSVAGPGIVINGDTISSSLVTVNGIYPTNGNISITLTNVITGPLNTRPFSAADATVFIVSQDQVASNDGDAYIYVAATGTWEPIAPLDQVAADARYLKLDASNGPMQGTLNMGTWDLTNVGTMFGTATTASFITGSGVYGPFGANSVESASNATTASFITGSDVYGPYGANSVLTASYAMNVVQFDPSRITSGSTVVQTYDTGLVEISGSSDATTKLVISGSLVVGYNTAAGVNSVAYGTGSSAAGAYSFAHGDRAQAAQGYSHAEGQLTVANAAYSHAEGQNTRVDQSYAHAEGSFTTASAQYSHTEGYRTITSGFYSHAEGYQTLASGEASHAEGSGSTAYGFASHAEGQGTIASGSYQSVVGTYNKHNNTASLFIVGNGADDANRNDIALFNSNTIALNADTIVSSSGTPLTVMGSGTAQPLFLVTGSQGELFAITDSLVGSLFVVNDIDGYPQIETFSDGRTLLGNSLAPSLYTTAITVINTGAATTIYSIPTAGYDGAFFDYTARSGSSAKAGQIIAIWNGSDVNYTEITTAQLNNASDLTLGVSILGANMILSGSATTNGWTVKAIIRSI